MIEIGERPAVVLQAAPFCFGPISTSLAIAEYLQKLDIAVVWFAEGTALELLRAGQCGDYVLPFRLSSEDDRRSHAHILREAKAIVVNTDPEFAEFALEHNPDVFYVDILYWMWHQLPAVVSRCRRYVYEDFVRSGEQLERLGLPAHSFRTGPLIGMGMNDVASTSGGDHLLVSLGGLHRPNRAASGLLKSYERMVREALVDALHDTDAFPTVYFAGGGVEQSEVVLDNGVVLRSGCLSRGEHQRLLRTARAAVMAPGLTGFYEVATAGVPVFFLPPHNYSQYLQLASYEAALSDAYYCDWQQLGIDAELPCFLPEEEMLEQVDGILDAVVERGREPLAAALKGFVDGAWRRFEPGSLRNMLSPPDLDGAAGAEQVADILVRHVEECTGDTIGPSTRTRLDQVPPPRKATLELFGGCQLRCPLCPTGNRITPGRAKGPMTIATARAILDKIGDDVKVIDLFNWGEPFLNRDACAIIRLIADRGIRTVLSSNLQVVPDPGDLVASGLSELIVSCHGMTQETYGKYMVGGSVDKTLRNLDRIVAAAGPDPAMKIVLRFVVFAHNEHELPMARERFRDTPVTVEASMMRMDMRNEILGPVSQNLVTYAEWVPDSSRFYDKQRLEATRRPIGCNLPFEEVVIDVDGDVSTCCSSYDPVHNLGNCLTEGFTAIWNGDRYQEARRVVTGRGETHRESIICRTCKNGGYRDF